jgi:plasmid stabilization system protein ParE
VTEVSIHPEAEAEYEDALAWYYERSPRAAERFQAAFDEAVEAIRAHPGRYPELDEAHRLVLVGRYPYSLIYRLDGDAARVIAVAHAKRLPRYWSDRN